MCVCVEDELEEAKRPGRRLLLLSRYSLDLYREVGGYRAYLGGKTDLVSNGTWGWKEEAFRMVPGL